MNFKAAKKIAQADALSSLEGIYSGDPSEVLDSRFEETEHCWMFFQHPSIQMPPERALSQFAYVIAKDASLGGRNVPDYRGNEPRLQEYLKTVSEFFGRGAPTSR